MKLWNFDGAWRVEWSLRTGISAAVAAIVFLAAEPRKFFQFQGHATNGPAFAGFVVVMVADVNFGRTAINGWGCILVACFVSFILSGVLAATSDGYSEWIAVPVIAILVFLLQLMNLPPMGKKLGMSLVTLHLISSPEADAWKDPLYFLVSTLAGVCIAFVGIFLPWPRCAFVEVASTIRSSAMSLNTLIRSLLVGVCDVSGERSAAMGSVRRELLTFVQKQLQISQVRQLETRWGPRRADALNRNARLLYALDISFQSGRTMCDMFETLHFEKHAALETFCKRITPGLLRLSDALQSAFMAIATVEEGVLPVERISAEMNAASTAFESVYLEARRQVLYNAEGDLNEITDTEQVFRLNTFFLNLKITLNCLRELLENSVDLVSAQCCDNKLLGDLFPSQRHCLLLFHCPLSKVSLQQLLAAFKLAFAICLASCWGFLAFDTPRALPAFTIAYIGGSSTSGADVGTSQLRAFGTAAAAVFASIVDQMIKDFTRTARTIIAGIAIVIFVIPATFFRSNVDVSYGGTVAGFTATLLLLQTPEGNVGALSINRITDTFVGVFILIMTDFIFWPQYSEPEMFEKIASAVQSVDTEIKSCFSILDEIFEKARESNDDGACTPRRMGVAVSQNYVQRMSLVATQRLLHRAAGLEIRLCHVHIGSDSITRLLSIEEELLSAALSLSLTLQCGYSDLSVLASNGLRVSPLMEPMKQFCNQVSVASSHIIANIRNLSGNVTESDWIASKESATSKSDFVAAVHAMDKSLQTRSLDDLPSTTSASDPPPAAQLVISSNAEATFVSGLIVAVIRILNSLQEMESVVNGACARVFLKRTANLRYDEDKLRAAAVGDKLRAATIGVPLDGADEENLLGPSICSI